MLVRKLSNSLTAHTMGQCLLPQICISCSKLLSRSGAGDERRAGMNACLTRTRRLKNKPEETFRQHAIAHGYTPCKRGWPDFICCRGHEVMVVEVKPHKNYNLKKQQKFVLRFLAAHGINCYRWSPDTCKLTKIKPYK